MPNTGANDWDEGHPLITDPRRDGAGEILNLRKAVRGRFNKEHATAETGDVTAGAGGGEHKQGSAVTYVSASAPTLRPDGVTSLDTDDEGRLWYEEDTGYLHYWTGSAWEQITDGPSPQIAQFEKNNGATLPSLPFTQTGLTPGTYIVWLYGASDYTDNEDPITISATINSVTRTCYLANQPDGNVPFNIPFHITVTGSGECSLTATSGIAWLGSMSGILTVAS
jgi:hypothetical protein